MWHSNFAVNVLMGALHHFEKDRIPLIAAGAAFFILLAIFPAFASIVSLYGLFADRSTIAHEIYRVSAFLPRGAVITLNAELNRLINQPIQTTGITFVASTFVALWSASGGFKAVLEGLDIAYDVKETRGFIRLSGIALLITALGIVVVAVTLNVAVVLPIIFSSVPFYDELRMVVSVLSWPAAFMLGMMSLSLIYSFGPNGRRRWHWFSWGAFMAAALWLAGTAIFKLYVANFGSFDRVYGSLGAAIGFMIWIWLSLLILLLGAELNREIERQRVASKVNGG